MKNEFNENEVKEINKALERAEDDIKNGRVGSYEELWERMDNIIEKYSKIPKKG